MYMYIYLYLHTHTVTPSHIFTCVSKCLYNVLYLLTSGRLVCTPNEILNGNSSAVNFRDQFPILPFIFSEPITWVSILLCIHTINSHIMCPLVCRLCVQHFVGNEEIYGCINIKLVSTILRTLGEMISEFCQSLFFSVKFSPRSALPFSHKLHTKVDVRSTLPAHLSVLF